MIGLILIYFLGKAFYDLADEFDKHQWGWGIAGVVSYYAGTIIAGLGIGVYYELYVGGGIDAADEFGISLLCIPFGLLLTYLFYIMLKKRWSSVLIEDHGSDILDGGDLTL